jgi:hypothetical protein
MYFLKGQCHEIFNLNFFFIEQLPLGPWYTGLSLFAYGLEFAKIFNFEIVNFGLSGVNDTAQAKNDPWITPIFFCVIVIAIG